VSNKAKTKKRDVLRFPKGVSLVRTIHGYTRGGLAWSPDGLRLAASTGETVQVLDVETGTQLSVLKNKGAIGKISFDPTGRMIVAAGPDPMVTVWDTESGTLLDTLEGHSKHVRDVSWSPDGKLFASASTDATIRIWDATSRKLSQVITTNSPKHVMLAVDWASDSRRVASASYDAWIFDALTGNLIHRLQSGDGLYDAAWSPDPKSAWVAAASSEKTIQIWDSRTGRKVASLEGHTRSVRSVAVSNNGQVLASASDDGNIRLWNCKDWRLVASVFLASKRATKFPILIPKIAFHPQFLCLAVGGKPNTIQIWKLDLQALLGSATSIQTSHYVNAKVVLLGDTGVGKSGLSLVLNGKPFKATDSTPGRRVWTFQSVKVRVNHDIEQTRQALLWDLAGQPGYRIIHQLHLNEVAVALVVFDARSETDPLAGVRHWERALRLAQQRQGASAVPMKKFLVSARSDRGTVSVSKERLEALVKEFGFEGYFETSAKEGWKIKELQKSIKDAIPWVSLPQVSSSELFVEIKSFLLRVKKTGRLIARAAQLYDEFVRGNFDKGAAEPNLRDQFDTCIGRLENRDLIRQLSFGGYVLLQPELLDAYASAIVNAAKKEPDGLGSIAEDAVLAGQFYVPDEQKIRDRGQEQLLLHATVEELVRHDLALRENATDGRYLVFPSEFIRDYEAAPEPKGKTLAITFSGPVQSLYSTLAVRLGHSGLFTTGRAEMWRNAAVFTARAGGKCGLYLQEFEEARGRLVIFYDSHEGRSPSDETRFHFEEFVLAHARRHSLHETVESVRFFVCSNGHPVPDEYVKLLSAQGKKMFDCPCGARVSLAEPIERLQFGSKVELMERSADRQRAFEVFVESARGETSTPGFTEWAGDDRVTLAIVFTDVVGSTALGQELGDALMEELRRAHFDRSRKLIKQYKGREIKTIGDSFMAAFKSVGKALDYALALQTDPGHEKVAIRAGLHIGSMTVEENDVFGGTVNFAARVVSAIKGAEIWLSNEAKADLVSSGAREHTKLKWKRQEGVEMKGFNGKFTLWSLNSENVLAV
jgi:class 3 adenylate cyclase/GTPase SAR1 family protein